MDLALFDTKEMSEKGQEMPVLDFDWQTKTGAVLYVYGPDSPIAAKIAHDEEIDNKRALADIMASRTPRVEEDEENTPVNKEIEKCLRLLAGWDHVEWRGSPLPFNPENARKVISCVTHIRKQILAFYGDRSNFTNPAYADWKKQSAQPSDSIQKEKTA